MSNIEKDDDTTSGKLSKDNFNIADIQTAIGLSDPNDDSSFNNIAIIGKDGKRYLAKELIKAKII